jgi:hypothetical protein
MTEVFVKSKKSSKNIPHTVDLNRPHHCGWCHRDFARESTLQSHVCEPRRRSEARHDPDVVLAFAAYNQFHAATAPVHQRTAKSYQEFCNSRHYVMFVKFGAWLREQVVQEPEKYVNWLLRNRVEFVQWCDVIKYQEFLAETLDHEPSQSALERSLRNITAWSEQNDITWTEFFHKVHPNVACAWIQQGKLSPWMLYNSDSAVALLERCSAEQLGLIQSVAPIHKWKVRFMRHKQEADSIRWVLQQAGI